jgi:hypothetical protein
VIQINNGTPQAWSYGAVIPRTFTGDYRVGSNQDFGEKASGLIDSVGFWKRVLSSGERTTLYNSGNGIEYPF